MKFFDAAIEKQVLAGFLKGPQFWRNVPTAWFYDPLSLKTYTEFLKLLDASHAHPTADLIRACVSDIEVKLFVIELGQIEIDLPTLNVYLQKLFEMYGARRIRDITQAVPDELAQVGVEALLRQKIVELSSISNPLVAGERLRGFIYEDLDDDKKYYEDIERDPALGGTTPYFIPKLDEYTAGGLHPGDIVLLYGGTGGYKTMTKANLAYNFAFWAEKHVMVMTLEVKMSDYRRIIESRHALLNYDKIREGQLEHQKNVFFNALQDIEQNKPSLYLVDIPDRATSADVKVELDKYHTQVGFYPDILIIDYLNEMEPLAKWNNTSEKFKNLGVELRRIIRSYPGLSLISSMQENRQGTMAKNKENLGLETIGESHYMSNVCSLIIHLYQSADGVDEDAGILNMAIRKSRWGPKHKVVEVDIDPVVKFVGENRFRTKRKDDFARTPSGATLR